MCLALHNKVKKTPGVTNCLSGYFSAYMDRFRLKEKKRNPTSAALTRNTPGTGRSRKRFGERSRSGELPSVPADTASVLSCRDKAPQGSRPLSPGPGAPSARLRFPAAQRGDEDGTGSALLPGQPCLGRTVPSDCCEAARAQRRARV